MIVRGAAQHAFGLTIHGQAAGPELPPLVPGERLKQPEFHRRYQAYPEDVKFELIGGTVYVGSPLRRVHGSYHPELATVLCFYKSGTPGVEVLDNTTAILGEESEPQPDLELRILSPYGGRSRETKENYVEGPPELMVEVSHSTKVLDLRHKRSDYEKADVLEHMVLSVEEQELYGWHFPSGRMIKPDRRSIARSVVFPGLWIHRRPCWFATRGS